MVTSNKVLFFVQRIVYAHSKVGFRITHFLEKILDKNLEGGKLEV